MTLVEKPCVCVFHTQDGSKGTRQNVGQGRGRRPTWARLGQCRGRGAWVPPRLTPGRSQELSPRLLRPGDAEEGLACLPPPSGGMGAKQPLPGAGGWPDPRQPGQGCRASGGPHAWTRGSGPGSFLQEIVSPENQKPSEQLSMKSNVDFF